MKKPLDTDSYLAALPDDQRRALEKLREQIVAAAPGVEDHFGYGLPGFKLDGHPLVYFGAARQHCALYGSLDADAFAAQLEGFKRSKGAIQFTPERPIPAAVVKGLVKAKVAAHRARWGTSR